MSTDWAPDRGDIVWITMDPSAGHEQSGRRPALVLSPRGYNALVGLAVLCPITTQVKGYPFEITLPDDLDVRGVVLSDQARSLDWRSRRAKYACSIPVELTQSVLRHLNRLLEP